MLDWAHVPSEFHYLRSVVEACGEDAIVEDVPSATVEGKGFRAGIEEGDIGAEDAIAFAGTAGNSQRRAGIDHRRATAGHRPGRPKQIVRRGCTLRCIHTSRQFSRRIVFVYRRKTECAIFLKSSSQTPRCLECLQFQIQKAIGTALLFLQREGFCWCPF